MRKLDLNTYNTNDIYDITTVINFLGHLIRHEKLDLHPDTPFNEYGDKNKLTPTYDEAQAYKRQLLMVKAKMVCGQAGQNIYRLVNRLKLQLTCAKG